MTNKILFLTLMTLSISLYSVSRLEIAVSVGYTSINFDSLLEKDEGSGTTLDDWDQFTYGASAQYYFYQKERLLFGAELQLQHLYSYSVLVPGFSSASTRYYSVNVVSMSPIMRYVIWDETSVDFGPVLMIDYDDNVDLGLFVAFSHFLVLSETTIIPLKLRLDIRGGTETSVPITISSGVVLAL